MVAIYTLCIVAFAVMIAALIRDPFKHGKGRMLVEGYTVQTKTNDVAVVETVLFKNGAPVCRDETPFNNERAATLNILQKYYKQLEKEYIARTRRVNYALGERQTVTKIRKTFSHTMAAREVQSMMEGLEREDGKC